MRVILPQATFLVKLFTFYLQFWLIETPVRLFKNLLKLLLGLEHFLSLTLMLKTFFRPWKNETRPGYVAYAVGIAAAVRFFLVIFDLILLATVFILGLLAILFFTALPLISVFLIFQAITRL